MNEWMYSLKIYNWRLFYLYKNDWKQSLFSKFYFVPLMFPVVPTENFGRYLENINIYRHNDGFTLLR